MSDLEAGMLFEQVRVFLIHQTDGDIEGLCKRVNAIGLFVQTKLEMIFIPWTNIECISFPEPDEEEKSDPFEEK